MSTLIQMHTCTIVTKYIPATDTKGARVRADAGMKRTVTVPYNHSLDTEAAHAQAAKALCEKFKWDFNYIQSGMEKGFAFVSIPSEFL